MDADRVILFFLEAQDFCGPVHQHFQCRGLHPAHRQGLVIQHMAAVGAEQHTREQPHFILAVRAFSPVSYTHLNLGFTISDILLQRNVSVVGCEKAVILMQ